MTDLDEVKMVFVSLQIGVWTGLMEKIVALLAKLKQLLTLGEVF